MSGLAGALRFSGGVNVRDQIVPVLGLLETAESHLGSWDIFLGVFEVFELKQLSVGALRHQIFFVAPYQSVLLPLNCLVLVCIRVRETLDLTSLSPEQTVEVGTDLVTLGSVQVVALSASCLSCVSFRKLQ